MRTQATPTKAESKKLIARAVAAMDVVREAAQKEIVAMHLKGQALGRLR